jgi:protein transport protein SEC13
MAVCSNTLITTVDTQHEEQIHDTQFDFYGTRLATASSDKSIKIFEVSGDQSTILHTIQEHDGHVWQISWAHPKFGTLLASAGYDKKVIIHTEQDGVWKTLYTYTDHTTSVNTVQFAPAEYGLVLACGSTDGDVSILSSVDNGVNWHSERFKAHSSGVNAVSWAPPNNMGNIICEPSNAEKSVQRKRLVTAGSENELNIWAEVEGQWTKECELSGHSEWIRDVAWAPSVGLNRSIIASCDFDGDVRVWVKNEGTGWEAKVLCKYNHPVWHVSWSVTGNVLAVSGGDNSVSLWKEYPDLSWKCISDNDDSKQIQGS